MANLTSWGSWEEGHWRFWYIVCATGREGLPRDGSELHELSLRISWRVTSCCIRRAAFMFYLTCCLTHRVWATLPLLGSFSLSPSMFDQLNVVCSVCALEFIRMCLIWTRYLLYFISLWQGLTNFLGASKQHNSLFLLWREPILSRVGVTATEVFAFLNDLLTSKVEANLLCHILSLTIYDASLHFVFAWTAKSLQSNRLDWNVLRLWNSCMLVYKCTHTIRQGPGKRYCHVFMSYRLLYHSGINLAQKYTACWKADSPLSDSFINIREAALRFFHPQIVLPGPPLPADWNL